MNFGKILIKNRFCEIDMNKRLESEIGTKIRSLMRILGNIHVFGIIIDILLKTNHISTDILRFPPE